MRHFDDIFAVAAARKGGDKALKKLLPKPASRAKLRALSDDRWLSAMSQSVFQAGFVWRIVEQKWPDFERAFDGFDLHATAYMSDEAIGDLLNDPSVIRHHKKLLSVRENASYLLSLCETHGSAAKFFADYPSDDYIGLLDELKTNASRLGGTSAQYCLRRMGKDSFILSRDVVAALMREKVIDKAATSKRDRRAVQEAFNIWCEQGSCSLTEMSRILAMSIES